MRPVTGIIRLLIWFQGFQALRNLHTFECQHLLPGELLHILQGPPSLPLTLPPSGEPLTSPRSCILITVVCIPPCLHHSMHIKSLVSSHTTPN